MTRRQLLGASLAGIIAALCLPFERFAEWCSSWLGPKRRTLFEGVNRIVVDPYIRRGRASFMRTRAYPPGVIWMHPLDYDALRTELA